MGNLVAPCPQSGDGLASRGDGERTPRSSSPSSAGSPDSQGALGDSKLASEEAIPGGEIQYVCCHREAPAPFTCLNGSPESCLVKESITVTAAEECPQQRPVRSDFNGSSRYGAQSVEEDEAEAPPPLPRGASSGSGQSSQQSGHSNHSAEAQELVQAQQRIQKLLLEQQSIIDGIVGGNANGHVARISASVETTVLPAAPCRMALPLSSDEPESDPRTSELFRQKSTGSWRPLSRSMSWARSKTFDSLSGDTSEAGSGGIQRQRSRGFPAVVDNPQSTWP